MRRGAAAYLAALTVSGCVSSFWAIEKELTADYLPDALSYWEPPNSERVMFPDLVSGLRYLASSRAARRRINEKRARAWQGKTTGLSVDTSGSDLLAGPSSPIAHEILDNYKSRSIRIRKDYLESLANDSLSYLEERNGGRMRLTDQQTLMADSVKSTVDRVFGILEPYVSELNRLIGSSELHLSCTNPASVTEKLDYDRYGEANKTVTRYRARISTCRLSVIVRGNEDQVQFFLLPVEMVMGLSQVEDQYAPIMTFSAYSDGYSVEWDVEKKPLTAERLERYCFLVLDYLLKLTRDDLARTPDQPCGAA